LRELLTMFTTLDCQPYNSHDMDAAWYDCSSWSSRRLVFSCIYVFLPVTRSLQ